MNRTFIRLALGALIALLTLPLTFSTALAHGHVTAGDYELVIGFRNEPPYQGQPNGLDLIVTNTKTKEKVKGLETTLKAEIIRGDAKRELKVIAQWGKDGYYTAHMTPSEAGAYTWHIFGSINGMPLDVSLASGPGSFNNVEALSATAFPVVDATPAELAAQTRTALLVGAGGVVLGLAGLVVGLIGLRARREVTRATVARQTA